MNFVHTVSHELSPEELHLVRQLALLTTCCPQDAPGVYDNELNFRQASREAVAVAEEIMERTKYAFNFVRHGQHESGNIRALLDQHTEPIPHSNTTIIPYVKVCSRVSQVRE